MRICTVDGCEKELKAKGLCNMHLKRLERTGDVGSPHSMNTPQFKPNVPKTPLKVTICNISGCEEISVGMWFCDK